MQEDRRAVINIHCEYRDKSEDSFSLVVEKAFATHMCCVLTWNAGFCAYPWSLSDKHTSVFQSPLSKQQDRDLVQWCKSAGVEVQQVSFVRLLKPCQLDLKRWWIVPFSARCRSSRRYVCFVMVILDMLTLYRIIYIRQRGSSVIACRRESPV